MDAGNLDPVLRLEEYGVIFDGNLLTPHLKQGQEPGIHFHSQAQ